MAECAICGDYGQFQCSRCCDAHDQSDFCRFHKDRHDRIRKHKADWVDKSKLGFDKAVFTGPHFNPLGIDKDKERGEDG